MTCVMMKNVFVFEFVCLTWLHRREILTCLSSCTLLIAHMHRLRHAYVSRTQARLPLGCISVVAPCFSHAVVTFVSYSSACTARRAPCITAEAGRPSHAATSPKVFTLTKQLSPRDTLTLRLRTRDGLGVLSAPRITAPRITAPHRRRGTPTSPRSHQPVALPPHLYSSVCYRTDPRHVDGWCTALRWGVAAAGGRAEALTLQPPASAPHQWPSEVAATCPAVHVCPS